MGNRRLLGRLAEMPGLTWPAGRVPAVVTGLVAAGLLADHDLPQAIIPAAPAELDGWRFA